MTVKIYILYVKLWKNKVALRKSEYLGPLKELVFHQTLKYINSYIALAVWRPIPYIFINQIVLPCKFPIHSSHVTQHRDSIFRPTPIIIGTDKHP